MEQSVCHWVELKLLHHCLVLLAVDVEVHYIDVWSVNNLAELAHWANERHCYRSTVLVLLLTVDVAWDKTLLARQFRGLLAKVGALLTCYVNLFHF